MNPQYKANVCYILHKECDHHLDTLVGPFLVVALGALYRVQQAVTIIWDTWLGGETFI